MLYTLAVILIIAWLLGSVDFNKEGRPIIWALVVGIAIYFAYRILGRPKQVRQDS